ncbi:MAG TPA: TlyA family RNA methyltransferase [Bacteroidia bacterium]|nr:TlyA family RNA methyltransferase [Bacteroidia bacterium]HNU32204.1 TlyA family RNA methyltransferase [Bacteroidia bacterium]
MRLDIYLTENNFLETRTKAKLAIEKGLVRVNTKIILQSAYEVKKTDVVYLISPPLKFVSKGGDKLQKAISHFNIKLQGKTVLDVGASTGGFTDCCLQNGAAFVFAVDVGTNQLHESLKNNTQIKSLEKLHIKNLAPEHLNNTQVDAVVIDVSFISIKKVLPELTRFTKKNSIVLALIKPQFEITEKKKFKGGIIKDLNIHSAILDDIQSFARSFEFNYINHIETDIDPTENKNLEFVMLFEYNP